MVNGRVLRCGPAAHVPVGSVTGFKNISTHESGLGRKALKHGSPGVCHAQAPIDEVGLEGRKPVQDSKISVPGSLGYSFTPGGLLLPYYIGELLLADCNQSFRNHLVQPRNHIQAYYPTCRYVSMSMHVTKRQCVCFCCTGTIHALQNLGLIGEETPVSGSSAGAIAAALIASGMDHKDCLEANKRLQLEILQNGTFQKLRGPLRNSMMVWFGCRSYLVLFIGTPLCYNALNTRKRPSYSVLNDFL